MSLASTLLLTSLPLLISLYADRYKKEDELKAFPPGPPDFGLPVNEKFDFIVGGGGAGCVLARRLADARFSVLLLEAGGDPPPLQSVPMLSVLTNSFPEINFLYQSTPQKKAALANNGILRTSAGKMLGGSTSHNDMMYERGSPYDYNGWAKFTGDWSWKYSNLFRFFLKLEDYMGSQPGPQHASGGPITVSMPKFAPGKEIWLDAGRERGFTVQDSNGPQKMGFSLNEFTKKFGRRVSTYTGYIQPVEGKLKNLVVRRYSLVSKVVFKKRRAVGVVYTRHGIPRYASARKEVILSAGAYISPIILIQSGIGPRDQLKAANVKPISIRPVGFNLMDHPFQTVGPIYVNDHSKAWELEQNCTFKDFKDFIQNGEGPMTSSYTVGIAEAFIASKRARTKENPNWPDLQIYYEFLGEEKNSVQCYVGFNRAYSRGRITLNTSATGMEDDRLPIIDYNYYSVESDLDVTIEGINFCLDTIEKTDAFKRIGASFTTVPIPQCKHLEFRSQEYWRCYVRQTVDSTYHASGTCRMGKRRDKRSVVDSKLRVIGVQRLRVVDASIMPRVTNANIAVPTMMIAEKAAHMIIRRYKRRQKKTGNGTLADAEGKRLTK